MFKPRPKQKVSEWSDENRVLSSETGPGLGKWDTSKAEYQREPMDAISDPETDEVTAMKPSQSGFTQSCVDNPIGYFIDMDPGPMMAMFPGLKEANEWSKNHFDTMVRDCEALHSRVTTERIKDKTNSLLLKRFPGGLLFILGANTAKGYRFRTAQRVFMDDLDDFPLDVEGQGDPVELARKRLKAYQDYNPKLIKISSPTERGVSLIEREFFASDQRHFHVPCPHCGHFQFMVFSKQHSQFANLANSELKFDKENLSWVYYECENCRKPIDEKYRTQIIQAGKWRALKPEIKRHAGFQFSDMISLNSSWRSLAKTFLSAKTRLMLKTVVNTNFGETFEEDKILTVEDHELAERVEKYTKVPKGVLVLTSQTDVQDDRLINVVLGWGKGYENWFIAKREIYGSPERKQTWEEHDELLKTTYEHESGLKLRPWTAHGLNIVCVDSGFSTENVYRYVKTHDAYRFFATKGEEGEKKPFIINVHKKNKIGARLAILGVDSIKTRIYDRLAMQKNQDGSFPAGWLHFNEQCNKEFFEQLTAEKRVWKRNPRTGRTRRAWEPREGRENHIFDCYVMGYAAITLLNPNWEKLEQRLNERATETIDEDTEPKRKTKKKRSSNWATMGGFLGRKF